MDGVRNIYIDCGAWTGDSIKEFKKHYQGYEIYAFECEPRLKNDLENLSKELNFTFINKAVWIDNTTLDFYLGVNNLTQSSTLFSNKKKFIDRKKSYQVQALDFSEWITKNFSPDDNIICKMNIEGAEYSVLPYMITHGSLKYIKTLYVAWHYNKLKGFNKDLHDCLIPALASSTNLKKWDYDENKGNNPF